MASMQTDLGWFHHRNLPSSRHYKWVTITFHPINCWWCYPERITQWRPHIWQTASRPFRYWNVEQWWQRCCDTRQMLYPAALFFTLTTHVTALKGDKWGILLCHSKQGSNQYYSMPWNLIVGQKSLVKECAVYWPSSQSNLLSLTNFHSCCCQSMTDDHLQQCQYTRYSLEQHW